MFKRHVFKSGCLLLFIPWLLVQSCNRRSGADDPVDLVCVVDLTKSIESQAQAESLDLLHATIGILRRGDAMTVIPITSDAATEGQGRVIRIRLAQQREAFDDDLGRLAETTQRKLQDLRMESAASLYRQTDLLGTMELVAEEISNVMEEGAGQGPRQVCRALVVLSDFIQDDAAYNFKRDANLSSEASAKKLAGELAAARSISFRGVNIYLGFLRSGDLRKLAPARRAAIRAFWEEYFRVGGASHVFAATDGSGQFDRFLKVVAKRGPESRSAN